MLVKEDNMISCRLCHSDADLTHTSKILNKHDVKYYHCSQCDLLQTEKPYWLEDAYSASVSSTDCGIMLRNNMVSKRLALFLYRFGLEDQKILDYAAGYGLLVRLMRDFGFKCFWNDLFSQNLIARGFESKPDERYPVLTAFEVFEHFDNPQLQINDLFTKHVPEFLILETGLRKVNHVPDPNSWGYYSTSTGQHVAFYSIKTMEYIAKHWGYSFWQHGRLMVFSKKPKPKISLSKKLGLWISWLKVYIPDQIPHIKKDQIEREKALI